MGCCGRDLIASMLLILWTAGAAQGYIIQMGVRPTKQQQQQQQPSSPSKAPRRAASAIGKLSSSSVALEAPRLPSMQALKTAVPSTKEQRESNDGKTQFKWNKQWYPVLAVKTTDPGRAHAVRLLGKDLVVWRNNEGRWSAFDDRCPHRAAPLTEGRVEKDGSLLCAYHAWRFDADGKCLSIPQSERGGRDEAQDRACARRYPTQVVQDMIWVWAENGRDAVLESAVTPLARIPELDDVEAVKSGRVTVGAVLQRDLPYAWETFMENVLDPSHVVVSHHGVMGTRDQAAPVKLQLENPAITTTGFKCSNLSPMWKASKGCTYFVPPALARTDTDNDDGSKVTFIVYNIPTSPGRSRMLVRQMTVLPEGDDANKGKPKMVNVAGLGRLLTPDKLPVWVQHVLGHKVLNQDLATLHHQEKILASVGPKYFKATFLPATADRAVVALRKWMDTFASGGPVWPQGCDVALPPREHNRDVLYNLYEQHTKSCTSCLGAVVGVKRGIRFCKASTVASVAWAVLRAARVVSSSANPAASVINFNTVRVMLPALATMCASLGAVEVLEKLLGEFHIGRHCHQDHD